MDTFFWFALLILFVVAEAATVNMVSAWFAIGSLASLITALLGGKMWLQVVVFLVVSGVMLALLRPLAKKYFTPPDHPHQCRCHGWKNLPVHHCH